MENFRNSNIKGRDMQTIYNYTLNSNISSISHMNNTPMVTPSINGQGLPPQTNYFGNFDNPLISSNVCNGVNAFNSSRDNFSSLPDNNPQDFSSLNNPSHVVNTNNYRGHESSIMHNSQISLQQQQKQVFEVFGFPGYKVELVFTPMNNQQLTQSMNTLQFGPNEQILSSQNEISGGNPQSSLNNCNNVNNSISSYVPGNNHVQQSSVIASMSNYQNCYNPSQQQNVFSRHEIPDNNLQSNCSSVNNFYRPM
ncbi:hypothetical protein RclHR1_00080013 [Rhizophagus clarus]|uniref:Uncharacterized protein n=1 Tax=Rhizophagus clarus TaxID=94130 RepID=A0A2Z6RZ85_9GLOM|nr:hypothetical protein RclHR1_00080013 [Rhizophagus clarus]